MISHVTCFRLAKLTAAVMLSRDVPVHLFSTFVPTPYVVRKRFVGVMGGVMMRVGGVTEVGCVFFSHTQ